VSVLSQESVRLFICVFGLPILPLSTILIFDFATDPTVCHFFDILFYTLNMKLKTTDPIA
jgi:hypothetical protein